MQISELRSEFYAKTASDGRTYKTLVNTLHESELIKRGWTKIGADEFVNSSAKLVFYGPDGALLSL